MKKNIILISLLIAPYIAHSQKPDMGKFLFMAVLNGLHNDGVDLELAKDIATEKHGSYFVGKCPVCGPVSSAFYAYYKGASSGWGKGLDEDTMKKLRSKKDKVRHMAFKMLVQKYVQARFANHKMTDAEKQAMRARLKNGRKRGMGVKSGSFGKFCPSCDGACKID